MNCIYQYIYCTGLYSVLAAMYRPEKTSLSILTGLRTNKTKTYNSLGLLIVIHATTSDPHIFLSQPKKHYKDVDATPTSGYTVVWSIPSDIVRPLYLIIRKIMYKKGNVPGKKTIHPDFKQQLFDLQQHIIMQNL